MLRPGGLFQPVSREGALVVNNVLLAVATGTVLLGTLYPLIEDVVSGQKGSVGPPYYALTFVPLMIPLIVAMGIGPLLKWKRDELGAVLRRVWLAFVLALGVAVVVAYLQDGGPVMALVGVALGVWLIIASLVKWAEQVRLTDGLAGLGRRIRRLRGGVWGMVFAHLGLGVAVLGMTASTAWEEAVLQVMAPGETVSVGGYDFTFEGVTPLPGPNYTAVTGRFLVSRAGRPFAVLDPETRYYAEPPMTTTEAAIRPTLWGDLYAVVGEEARTGGWAVRIYFKPLQHWIWWGAAIMGFGGLLSLFDRRWRVGVAARARARESETIGVPAT